MNAYLEQIKRFELLMISRSRRSFAFVVLTGLACLLMARLVLALLDDEKTPPPDRLKRLTSMLLPIAQEKGGGYFLSSGLSGLRGADFADAVKIPGIRQLEDNDFADDGGFRSEEWAQFAKLTQLEELRSYNNYVTCDHLDCLQDLSSSS